MARLIGICIIAFCIINSSCSSHEPKTDTANTTTDTVKPVKSPIVHHFQHFEAGRIVNYVKLPQDSNETIALYLPKGYDTGKSWPVIYFFDAHARGKLPLKKYSELAEKFGMIFIGSNNSQNGLKPEFYNKIVNDLLAGTQTIFNIDEKRITVSGFSGGAKVAGAAAIQNGDISSVIGCAAPMEIDRLGGAYFNYAGIVGKGDFNYWDMVALDAAFARTPLKHLFLTFNGIHEWPDKATFSKAILFTQQAAKKEIEVKSDSVDVSQQNTEEEAKRNIGKAFQAGEKVDWMAKINEYNNGFKIAKSETERWSNRRMLSFINLMAYLKTMDLLSHKKMDEAAPFIAVFKASDPKNPDGPILSADYFALKGEKAKAISSINEAMKLGYDDIGHLITDPMLATLKNEPGYIKAVEALE